MDKTLLIFIKNPQLGKVKTRLAATVGDENALLIYKQLLSHTKAITSEVVAKKLLFYSDFVQKDDDWSSLIFEKKVQSSGNLGERMKNAFQSVFAIAPTQKIVIIGSDCIALKSEILEQAFVQLETHDFVVGPAEDGGYYLIGMNHFYPQIFDDIVWSSEAVFSKTIACFEALAKKYFQLPTLSDIDNEEDWNKAVIKQY